MRTPALDSYFAITANLGTHTFFMVMLPILFWCGFSDFGKGYVCLLFGRAIVSGIPRARLQLGCEITMIQALQPCVYDSDTILALFFSHDHD